MGPGSVLMRLPALHELEDVGLLDQRLQVLLRQLREDPVLARHSPPRRLRYPLQPPVQMALQRSTASAVPTRNPETFVVAVCSFVAGTQWLGRDVIASIGSEDQIRVTSASSSI
eukprot:749320-Rhodomonas_salina.4